MKIIQGRNMNSAISQAEKSELKSEGRERARKKKRIKRKKKE